MENFKKILLGIIIGYVTIFSVLFIYNMQRINKQVNYEYEYSNIESYDKTMLLNKEKLNTYTNLASTQEQKKCLNTISKMIEESYKTYYNEPITIKKLIKNDYDSTIDTAVYRDCNLTQNTKDLITPLILGNNLHKNILFDNKTILYEITIPDYIIHLIAVPATDTMSYRVLKMNEANIIKLILDEVGEKYE